MRTVGGRYSSPSGLRCLDRLTTAARTGRNSSGPVTVFGERLTELEERHAELEEEMATAAAPPVRLHPNLAHLYRRKVEQLQEALNHPEIRDEAIQVLRGLLERVVLAPIEGGFDVEIVGEIAQMIEIGLGKGKKKGPVLNERMARSVKVVAGARNQRCLHLDHAIL